MYMVPLGTGFSDLEKYKPTKDDWKIAVDTLKVGAWDPAFHYDDDKNKLYLYWGSSNEWPLLGTEVKVKNLQSEGLLSPLLN